jgi:hypothetical protein
MTGWATRSVFIVAMLLPILVGLWLYSVVLASPLGTLFPQATRTPVTIGNEPTPTSVSLAADSTATVVPAASTPIPTSVALAESGAQASTRSIEPAPASPEPRESRDPVGTVRAFNQHVVQGDFDTAADLWTDDMRRRFPPNENIKQRFSQTWSIRVEEARLVNTTPDGQHATVSVQIVEVLGSPPAPQRFTGTWTLVRGPGGWLLDRPSLERR